MTTTHGPVRTPVSKELHPMIHKLLAGCALLLALAAWGYFVDAGGTAYILAVVTAFLFTAVAIPFEMWRIWRRDPASDSRHTDQSFRNWAAGRVQIQDHSMKARDAAIETLLPLGGAAVSLAIFALVLHLSVPAGAL